jgi:hypothetical protein
MVIPGNPRIETGINVFSIPICKRGDPVSIWGFVNPRYHMVIPGNPRIRMGIDVISIPIWKQGVPVPIWGFVNPVGLGAHKGRAGNFGFLAKILGGAPTHP